MNDAASSAPSPAIKRKSASPSSSATPSDSSSSTFATSKKPKASSGEIAFFIGTVFAILAAGYYYEVVLPNQEERDRYAEFDRQDALLMQKEEAGKLETNRRTRLPKARAGMEAGAGLR